MAKQNVAGLTGLLNRAISVEDILSDPLFVIRSHTTHEQAISLMEARGFDMIGVDSTGDGFPDSFVSREDLAAGKAPWRCAIPLLASMAVEKSMPLVRLMGLMKDRPHLFVLDGDHVGYIVTRADLSRPPIGLVTLAYLLALEQALLASSVHRIGGRWFEALPDARLKEVLDLYRKKKRTRVELGLEDCLYFDDVMGLATKAPDLLTELGITAGRFESLRDRFSKLRNDLAHGGTILDHMTPELALETFAELTRLTAAAEASPSSGADVWEAYAATHIVGPAQTVLVGSGAVSELPVSAPAAVLTAWNPGSRTVPDNDNESAQELLRDELAGLGLETLAVEGISPDGRWREPSLVVTGLAREDAVAMADRYGQAAMFELDDESVRVISVPDGGIRSNRSRIGS